MSQDELLPVESPGLADWQISALPCTAHTRTVLLYKGAAVSSDSLSALSHVLGGSHHCANRIMIFSLHCTLFSKQQVLWSHKLEYLACDVKGLGCQRQAVAPVCFAVRHELFCCGCPVRWLHKWDRPQKPWCYMS